MHIANLLMKKAKKILVVGLTMMALILTYRIKLLGDISSTDKHNQIFPTSDQMRVNVMKDMLNDGLNMVDSHHMRRKSLEGADDDNNATSNFSMHKDRFEVKSKETTKVSASPSTTKNPPTTAAKNISFFFEESIDCIPKHHLNFPLCVEKFNSLNRTWKNDDCLKNSVTNNTRCFLLDYLTRVEPYCAGRKDLYAGRDNVPTAKPKFGLEGFLKLFNDSKYRWIKDRATFYWPDVMSGVKGFTGKNLKYKRKNVAVYFGAFRNFEHFLVLAGKGGFLGELVQWTDLIISLYILGHEITIVRTAKEITSLFKMKKDDCPTPENTAGVDIIYTDITGLHDIRGAFFGERNFAKYNCKLRLLDSFGTFSEYNYKAYPHIIPGGRSFWGDLNLLMPQLLTLYPHTHDNRFLGFVSRQNNKQKAVAKKRQALLYAKHSYYAKNHHSYLKIISEYFEIHATCVESETDKLPSFVHNHGSVPSERVHELLAESALFIGVGFPYEGPGPLEAMSNGAVYLQPKFDKPINKLNSNFFGLKPTLRKLTSQNPYMEEFVGQPYCYTINITDETLLRNTLKEIQQMKPQLTAKIPREFTTEGFTERVHAYTSLTDLCNPYAPRWPPVRNLEIMTGSPGKSCKETCMLKGLVCEATYFDMINKTSILEVHGGVKCDNVSVEAVLHAPSVEVSTKTCYLQAHHLVFSCMHSEERLTRLCPCRNYEHEQSAICQGCLS